MNTLLGIFHLLLILAHNRLLPDMGSVWEPVSAKTIIISAVVYTGFELPTANQPLFQSEAMCEENRKFLTPSLFCREGFYFIRFFTQQSGPALNEM